MLTLDHINFYHFLNKRYPVTEVSAKKGSQFVSIFSTAKCYFATKVLDLDIEEITDANLEIVRSRGALIVRLSYKSATKKGYLSQYFPINPHLIRASTFPDRDELIEMEFHFIDALSGVLAKVVQIMPMNIDFTSVLVDQYLESEQMTRGVDEFKRHADYFVWGGSIDGTVILNSPAQITKQHATGNEPKFTGYRNAVDDALNLSNEALETLEQSHVDESE